MHFSLIHGLGFAVWGIVGLAVLGIYIAGLWQIIHKGNLKTGVALICLFILTLLFIIGSLT